MGEEEEEEEAVDTPRMVGVCCQFHAAGIAQTASGERSDECNFEDHWTRLSARSLSARARFDASSDFARTLDRRRRDRPR